MRPYRVVLSVLMLCLFAACRTGLEVKTSEQARHQAQIVRARAVGQERLVQVVKSQIKTMDVRIAEFRKRQAAHEDELVLVIPRLKKTRKKLKEATPVQRGYLEAQYNELLDRKEFLEARIGKFKQDIAFYEDQKSQFLAHLKAVTEQAERLREEAARLERLAAELELKERIKKGEAVAQEQPKPPQPEEEGPCCF